MEGKKHGTEGVDVDEAGLWLTVEEILREAMGRPIRVSALKRKPCPFATLFPVEVVSVRLRGGEALSLFVKHLGPEQSDHPEKQRRDREIRIYEELFGDEGLPVPRYYGSRWNEKTSRHEVFLEYVDDWNLKYHNQEHWFIAARRLAHLHAYFAARAKKLFGCDFLLRFDTAYLNDWAGRAVDAVAAYSRELERELRCVVTQYDSITEVLTRQPLTLVHNDPSPKNVIVDRSMSPARIYFVDWEMAGVGGGLMDLVHLKYGLDPVSAQKMCESYCAELAGTDLLPSDPQDLSSLFAACELHKALYRLASSKRWQVPTELVAQRVAEAQQFLAHV